MTMFNPIEKFTKVIIARITDEYDAHIFYRNAANWCNNKGYTKAGNYFENEAKEELEHAEKLQNYLNDWGVDYKMPAINNEQEFKSLIDLIGKAYVMESKLYTLYNSTISNEDYSFFSLFQEMINIQYKSVASYRTLLDKIKLVGTDKLSIFLFEKEAF